MMHFKPYFKPSIRDLPAEMIEEISKLLNDEDCRRFELAMEMDLGYVAHANRGLDYCLSVKDFRAVLRLILIGGLGDYDLARAFAPLLTHPSDAARRTLSELPADVVIERLDHYRNYLIGDSYRSMNVFHHACRNGRLDALGLILQSTNIYSRKGHLKKRMASRVIGAFLHGNTDSPVYQFLLQDDRFHLGLQGYRALTEVVRRRLDPLEKLELVDYILAHSPAAADATAIKDWQCALDHAFQTAFTDGSLGSFGVMLRLLDLGYTPRDNDFGEEMHVRKFGSICRVAMFLTKFLNNAIRRCRLDTVHRFSAAPVSVGGYEFWFVLPSTAHQLPEIKAWAKGSSSRWCIRYTPPADALIQMFTKWAKRDSGRNARAAEIVDVVAGPGYNAVARAPEIEGAVWQDGKVPTYFIPPEGFYHNSRLREAAGQDTARDPLVLEIAAQHADVRSLRVILERAAAADALFPGLYSVALKGKKGRVGEAFRLLYSLGCDPESAGEPIIRAAVLEGNGKAKLYPDWKVVEAVLSLPGLPLGNQAPLHEAPRRTSSLQHQTRLVNKILSLPGYYSAGAGPTASVASVGSTITKRAHSYTGCPLS